MNYFVKSVLALALTVILSGCPSPSPSPAPAPAAAGDTVAPVVVAPTSITVTVAAGNTSAPKTHASIAAFLAGASATDNVDGVITSITNNAPATFPAAAPTTVTFSATDAAGNTGTATATVTVAVSAPVAFNVIDGDGGAPIQGAVVRVDQTDYTTDVNGQVLITGADVGLHDIHAFASGYDWASLYQVTANSTGNTFTLYPVTTGSSANIQSQVVVDLNVPAGYVVPPVSMLEYTLTDASGNIFRSASRYPRAYITDPYTGATNIPIYQAQFYTAFPAATPLAGSTLSVAQISCDVNGLNCTSLSFTDIAQTFTTQDITTWGASATVSLTNNPTAVGVPVTSAKSEVVLDLNMTNSLLAVGAVYDVYAAAINAAAVFSVVDATTGQVTDYKGQASINISYATAPPTIVSTVASIDFGNIPVGTALTGNLSIVELQNYSDISNFVDLGQKTLTTIQAPYIKTATTLGAVAMAVPFPVVPAYPAADNTSAASSGASISATVLNSIYHDPNMSSPLGGYAWIALDLVTQDANGNTKVYTGELNATQVPVYDVYGSIVSFKNGTTSEGSIFFADLPPNTSVTGTLSAVELYYTFSAAGSLGAQQVQYVNLGVTTLTTGQPDPFWKGYKIPVGLPVPTNINVTFPVTPPTATTVLNINSASVPAGMVLTDAFVYSAGLSYVSAVEPVVLPHSFTSLAPITGNVTMRIGAVEPYTQASWFYASSFAAGTTVDIVSSLTAIPSIAANQTGATIQLTPSANTKTFVILSITDPAISSMQWSILLPATLTSVVLPTPPAGITNYWTVGNTYNLDTSDYVFSGTYAQFAAQYMGNASQQSLLLSSGLEGITSPQVPYQYQ